MVFLTLGLVNLIWPIAVEGQPLSNSTPSPTVSPMQVSNPFSQNLQRVLGMNRLATHIAEKQLAHQIHKKVTGEVDVTVHSYSGLDLAQGKAKGLRIQAHHVLYDQAFYVSELTLSTHPSSPIWLDTHTGKLKRLVQADLQLIITQADLNQSMTTPKLQDKLQHLNLTLPGMGKQTVALLHPQIQLTPGQLHFQSQFGIAGQDAQQFLPLSIDTGLRPSPDGEEIQWLGLTIQPIPGIPGVEEYQPILTELLSWLVRPSKLLPLKHGHLQIQTVQLETGKITLTAQVTLLPPSN